MKMAILFGLGLSLAGSFNAHAGDSRKLYAAVQNSSAKYLQSDAGVRGLCGDVYAALKERLKDQGINLVVNPQEKVITRILSELKYGLVDLYCGAGRNAEREQNYIYSAVPVYHVSNVLIVRANDDFNPRTLSELEQSGEEIMAFYGSSSARFLKENTSVKVADVFSDLDKTLSLLANGRRYRAFYYHDLAAKYYIQQSGYPLKMAPTRYRTIPQWIIYSQQTDKGLVAKVEEAMAAMKKAGDLEKITSPYLVPIVTN